MSLLPKGKPSVWFWWGTRGGMTILPIWIFWLGIGLAMEGCAEPSTPPTSSRTGHSAAKPRSDTQTPSARTEATVRLSPAQVRLQQVDKAGFDAWLQSQKGKVVLVDFWATWCMPCRELFPHTVHLHRQWASKGLLVAAVSMDDPDSEQLVRQFLAQQGADFENFLALGPPEPFEAFQIPGGAVPCVRIYGPDGKLFRELASGYQNIEPADIDKAVQQALAALPPNGQAK